jgi:hypothetical protein
MFAVITVTADKIFNQQMAPLFIPLQDLPHQGGEVFLMLNRTTFFKHG